MVPVPYMSDFVVVLQFCAAKLLQIFEIAKFFTTNPLNIYIYKDFCIKFGGLHNSANVNSAGTRLREGRSYNYFILIYASFWWKKFQKIPILTQKIPATG